MKHVFVFFLTIICPLFVLLHTIFLQAYWVTILNNYTKHLQNIFQDVRVRPFSLITTQQETSPCPYLTAACPVTSPHPGLPLTHSPRGQPPAPLRDQQKTDRVRNCVHFQTRQPTHKGLIFILNCFSLILFTVINLWRRYQYYNIIFIFP